MPLSSFITSYGHSFLLCIISEVSVLVSSLTMSPLVLFWQESLMSFYLQLKVTAASPRSKL